MRFCYNCVLTLACIPPHIHLHMKKKSLKHKQQFKNVLFEMNNVVGKQTKYSQVSEKGVDNSLVSFFIVQCFENTCA